MKIAVWLTGELNSTPKQSAWRNTQVYLSHNYLIIWRQPSEIPLYLSHPPVYSRAIKGTIVHKNICNYDTHSWRREFFFILNNKSLLASKQLIRPLSGWQEIFCKKQKQETHPSFNKAIKGKLSPVLMLREQNINVVEIGRIPFILCIPCILSI